MNYEKFRKILNKHIFEGEKKELLRSIANHPERFTGLFRPTKPKVKILQYLLQSHEIRMGSALEEIIEEILKSLGFKILSKSLTNEEGENLSLDHYFTDGRMYYFIEQKVRDDHDSTKKRGQISNFETKLKILSNKHGSNLIGIMYFVDPSLSKNKNYYLQELNRLERSYRVKLYILYGEELFNYFNKPKIWHTIVNWLKQWKDDIPELPEINFDATPEQSFEEIKDLELRTWRKIIKNQALWDEGIITAIFKEGTTLQLLLDFFIKHDNTHYKEIAKKLAELMNKYYGNE